MGKWIDTLAALAILAVVQPVTTQAASTMCCAHQLPPDHHIAKVIETWATEIRKEAGDDPEILFFGTNSLVSANKNIASVAKGGIEFAFSGNFQWDKTPPIMDVTLAPFAFGDRNLWRK